MNSIRFASYYGLGDNFYMRPFIIKAQEKYDTVHVRCPFPDLLYFNTDVKCIKPVTNLKTQKEWADKQDNLFVTPLTKYTTELAFNYSSPLIRELNPIYSSFNSQFPIDKNDVEYITPIEFIDKAKSLIPETNKKLCVLKLPTVRTEWLNDSRNPKMKYYQMLIDQLKSEYYFISVADTRVNEKLSEPCPTGIDLIAHKAEFDLQAYVGLLSLADLVIGYPSNVLPVCMTLKAPLFCIYGGSVPNTPLTFGYDTSKYGFIEPTKMCKCVKNNHNCNKEIKDYDLFSAFDKFMIKLNNPKKEPIFLPREYSTPVIARHIPIQLNRSPINKPIDIVKKSVSTELNIQKPVNGKYTLLISRLRAWRCKKILESCKDYFDVVTVDHECLDDYADLGFVGSYQYTIDSNCHARELTEHIIKTHKVTHALIAQYGNAHAMGGYDACKACGVITYWAENFFDDKLIVDSSGLPYMPKNDIIKFINEVSIYNPILPQKTREYQPENCNNLYDKYGVNRKSCLVFLAQLPMDESVKNIKFSNVGTYEQFIRKVIECNKSVKILIKYHPLDNSEKFKFELEYPNVIKCEESLDSLFENFDYFCSLSSTTILEAVIKNKKIATGGYHYLNNNALVYQLLKSSDFVNIIDTLKNFKINDSIKSRYLSFITNYYAVSMDSKNFCLKLLEGEDFYRKELRC
jgi:hypothetical protein